MPRLTDRLVVLGSLTSSFLLGMHVPAFHDVVHHGAAPRGDVVAATAALAALTLAGAWRLWRRSTAPR